jgi:hypothetical protein
VVYARKVDQTQKEIVEGLRAAGYRVEIIWRPVDLLVGRDLRTFSNIFGNYLFEWKLLETKTPTKTGKIRKRKDQEAQDKFCKETGTPRVTSLQEALEALK